MEKMGKNKIGMRKVEKDLISCKLILHFLKRGKNMEEEQRHIRYNLLEYYVSNIENLLGVSVEEEFKKVIEEIENSIPKIDGK